MFDAGAAIWNLREVVSAHLLLLLEAKRTMVGGDDLQRVARQSLPEFFLIPFFAERRSEHELRAFKARNIHIFQREVKILRPRIARLCGNVPAISSPLFGTSIFSKER